MKAMQPVQVSVVIPAYNAAGTIGAQLAALAGETSERSFEVLVVDNNSSDARAEVVAAHAGTVPGLRVVTAKERAGAAHARNAGVREARGNLLLFCDADDEVHAAWLDEMADALATADMVGGAIEMDQLNPPNGPALSAPRATTNLPSPHPPHAPRARPAHSPRVGAQDQPRRGQVVRLEASTGAEGGRAKSRGRFSAAHWADSLSKARTRCLGSGSLLPERMGGDRRPTTRGEARWVSSSA